MKILFVQRAPNRGGSTISAIDLVRSLRKEGHLTVVALGAHGEAEEDFQEIGGQVIQLPHEIPYGMGLRGVRRVIQAIMHLPSLVREVRRTGCDLIYVNSLSSIIFLIVGKVTGKNTVFHLRESLETSSEYSLKGYLKKLVVSIGRRLPTAIICNSEYTAKSFFGAQIPGKASVIHNGIADNFFEFKATREACRKDLGLPVDKKIIGIPGTLRPLKGQMDLLSHAKASGLIEEDYIFILTGSCSSEYGRAVFELARETMPNNVVFLGSLKDMRPFYRACDVVCVPSKEESFGRVIVEAMALRVPVVASGVGGIKEIINKPELGLLTEGQDIIGICSFIRMLLLSDGLRGRIAEAAYESASHRFRCSSQTQKVRRLLDRCMVKNSNSNEGRSN